MVNSRQTIETVEPGEVAESARDVPLRRVVSEWLFKAILRGELPAGSRLVLNRLASQLGVSATPIREAMVTLESLGLVAFRHNCGATIAPFGVKELREIYYVWSILDVALVRSACKHLDRDAASQLHKDMLDLQAEPISDSWSAREVELDRRLEYLIVGSSDCKRLAEETNRYQEFIDAIREVFGLELAHQKRALQDHLEIVEALLNGDPEIVASLVTRHNYGCAKVLEDAFRRHTQAARSMSADDCTPLRTG